MLIGAKGVSTSCTVVTLFNVTEDLDVASFDCATIRTGFGVTPLPREFHDVFPPSQHDDTSNGLSWLGVPSEGFTAYVYSTKRLSTYVNADAGFSGRRLGLFLSSGLSC